MRSECPKASRYTIFVPDSTLVNQASHSTSATTHPAVHPTIYRKHGHSYVALKVHFQGLANDVGDPEGYFALFDDSGRGGEPWHIYRDTKHCENRRHPSRRERTKNLHKNWLINRNYCKGPRTYSLFWAHSVYHINAPTVDAVPPSLFLLSCRSTSCKFLSIEQKEN